MLLQKNLGQEAKDAQGPSSEKVESGADAQKRQAREEREEPPVRDRDGVFHCGKMELHSLHSLHCSADQQNEEDMTPPPTDISHLNGQEGVQTPPMKPTTRDQEGQEPTRAPCLYASMTGSEAERAEEMHSINTLSGN